MLCRTLDEELSRSDLSSPPSVLALLPFVDLCLLDLACVELTSRSLPTALIGGGVTSNPTTTHPSWTDLFEAHKNARPKTAALRVRLSTTKRSGKWEGGEASNSRRWSEVIDPYAI